VQLDNGEDAVALGLQWEAPRTDPLLVANFCRFEVEWMPCSNTFVLNSKIKDTREFELFILLSVFMQLCIGDLHPLADPRT
jgi:hypothetical protein